MFPQYKNTLHSFQLIWQHEGLRGAICPFIAHSKIVTYKHALGFYKGFLVAEINYVLGNIFHYTGYEILKEKLQAGSFRFHNFYFLSIFFFFFAIIL